MRAQVAFISRGGSFVFHIKRVIGRVKGSRWNYGQGRRWRLRLETWRTVSPLTLAKRNYVMKFIELPFSAYRRARASVRVYIYIFRTTVFSLLKTEIDLSLLHPSHSREQLTRDISPQRAGGWYIEPHLGDIYPVGRRKNTERKSDVHSMVVSARRLRFLPTRSRGSHL